MASGVKVHADVGDAFEEMKIRHSYKYLIFKISDDQKEIIVDKKGGKEAKYEELIEALKEAELQKQGRYCVFDCEYDSENKRSKLLFIMWCSENAAVKWKMLYSSSKQALMDKIKGVGALIQANDMSDLEFSTLKDKCLSLSKA